ncbi:MAG: two component transcriptional regulator, LuxR family [Blastococcus sp.]|nr:two component transcriptional regulator, LuxR family [Blastococcus sp.]
MIDVLVVDDHALMRAGLTTLIDAAPDMRVVGVASDGREAVEEVVACSPRVVLMDLSMPNMDGVAATRLITAAHPDVEVLILTSFSDGERVLDALDAGAAGYLLKDAEPGDLIGAIRAVAGGQSPLDPRVARTLISARRAPSPSSGAAELTEREREVLALVGLGLANKQIARRLGIQEGTVKAHLTHVFQRIGVQDRTSAALWARRHLDAGGLREFPGS